jgi:hypothetical protein
MVSDIEGGTWTEGENRVQRRIFGLKGYERRVERTA